MLIVVATFGILITVAIYLMLQGNLLRLLLGISLLSAVINMAIMICGRLQYLNPAFIQGNEIHYANPVPQALVLTAIVIGFGFITYICTLLKIILPKYYAKS
ncbi:MAG: hypothetical protein Tsb005_15780 [Gammaproteobacteria bacterium]